MKRSLWNKRIPTLFGIILIIIAIGGASVAAQHRLIYLGNAASSETPTHLQITNITDTSFTVTYTTTASVIGSISYGISKNVLQVALDDRDESSRTLSPHTVHSITVKGLKPQTTYYFAIKSGGGTYQDATNLYQIATAEKINAPPTSSEKPLIGKVLLPSGSAAREVLIFAQNANSQLISTFVTPTGFFLLPLDTIRDHNLSTYLTLTNDVFQITAMDAESSSHISFSLNGDNAVPTFTLAQNYDFTQNSPTVTQGASPSVPPESFGDLSASSAGQTTSAISTPKANETFIDTQPEFKGTAPPNTKVQIEIHSSAAIKTQVSTSANGTWTFRPPVALAPGIHTISITFRDPSGILKTIQQSFTVFAQGSQVNQSATPSAATPTLTPTPTPRPTQTPTPKQTATTTPSPTTPATATVTPTLTPTASPSPTSPPTTTLSPTPALITGPASLPFIGFLGVATLVAGVVLFFAIRL